MVSPLFRSFHPICLYAAVIFACTNAITLDHIGNIILWTVVETGLGVVAGSLPSLRTFFKHLAKDASTQDYENSNGTDLVTIGKIKGRHNRVYDTEIGVTVVANANDEDSNQGDGDSTRHIIKVTKEVQQTSEEQSETAPEQMGNHPHRST